MKKLVALCVAGCMAVTLGACGGSGTSESISVTRETTPEPASDLTKELIA